MPHSSSGPTSGSSRSRPRDSPGTGRSAMPASVDVALRAVQEAATSDESLMPRILDAVRAEATLGEICGALRAVFGEYHPPATI